MGRGRGDLTAKERKERKRRKKNRERGKENVGMQIIVCRGGSLAGASSYIMEGFAG
jgi:hypothetical protein